MALINILISAKRRIRGSLMIRKASEAMKKLRTAKAGKVPRLCRQIGEPAARSKQELASCLRDALNGAQQGLSARTAPITNHLNEILLAMGYEASLVSLLGRKYGG